jgi:hypothetical protein
MIGKTRRNWHAVIDLKRLRIWPNQCSHSSVSLSCRDTGDARMSVAERGDLKFLAVRCGRIMARWWGDLAWVFT